MKNAFKKTPVEISVVYVLLFSVLSVLLFWFFLNNDKDTWISGVFDGPVLEYWTMWVISLSYSIVLFSTTMLLAKKTQKIQYDLVKRSWNFYWMASSFYLIYMVDFWRFAVAFAFYIAANLIFMIGFLIFVNRKIFKQMKQFKPSKNNKKVLDIEETKVEKRPKLTPEQQKQMMEMSKQSLDMQLRNQGINIDELDKEFGSEFDEDKK